MNTSDSKIAEVLAKFGEPVLENVWRVQGQPVIYHKALERIAAQAGIYFDPPIVLRTERDEAVILVTGHLSFENEEGRHRTRTEWSIGEALIGVNYRVTGKQAAYVYAMAEKRAKDRVILKLIELHGLLYSEEEADEFKEPSGAALEGSSSGSQQPSEGGGAGQQVRVTSFVAAPAAKPQLVPTPEESSSKRPWKDVPPAEQAGMIAEKPAFWDYLRTKGVDVQSVDAAAEYIRRRCGVKSRADISYGSPAYGFWQDLYASYAEWRRSVQEEA